MIKDCENCDYTDIADWEQDARTGKATPVYWCERNKKLCSEIAKCKYTEGSEDNE